jgi:hypothetical protein
MRTPSTSKPTAAKKESAPAMPPPPVKSAASDELLTKLELARKFKTSTRTVEEWQQHAALPFIKIGNIVRFYWPDVITHLRTHYLVCHDADREIDTSPGGHFMRTETSSAALSGRGGEGAALGRQGAATR